MTPNGMLVTYGPAPRMWCTDCKLVAPLSPDRAPAEVAQLARTHEHGLRSGSWTEDQ